MNLDRTHVGVGIAASENSLEGTHQEKKFRENEKISRAKSKNGKRLPILRQGEHKQTMPPVLATYSSTLICEQKTEVHDFYT